MDSSPLLIAFRANVAVTNGRFTSLTVDIPLITFNDEGDFYLNGRRGGLSTVLSLYDLHPFRACKGSRKMHSITKRERVALYFFCLGLSPVPYDKFLCLSVDSIEVILSVSNAVQA